jgi:enoyl-CoA hydratase/carnithine racemase
MVALSRSVHKKNAMEMLLTGDMISAQKAKDIGLINNYVEVKELESTVMKLAQKIAGKPSLTITTGKRAFYEQADMSLSKAYEHTSEVMKNNILREDAKEGISAFIEKRSPNWKEE